MDLISPGNGLVYWQTATFLVMVGYFSFWVYALIDLIRADFKEQHMQLIWALMILFVPVIGTFLYLSMNRRTKRGFRKFTPTFSSQQNTK